MISRILFGHAPSILLAEEPTPNNSFKNTTDNLSVKNNFYPEFGMNSPAYEDSPVNRDVDNSLNLDFVINDIMNLSIEELDFSQFQMESLRSLSIANVGDILRLKEEDLKQARLIGNKRSRKIFNIALNAAFDYISG